MNGGKGKKRGSGGDESTNLLAKAFGRALIETGRRLTKAEARTSVPHAATVVASTWKHAIRRYDKLPDDVPLPDIRMLEHVAVVLRRTSKLLNTEDRAAGARELVRLAKTARDLAPPPLGAEYEHFVGMGEQLGRSISRVGYRMLSMELPLPQIQYTAALNGIPPIAQEPLIRFATCQSGQLTEDLVAVAEALIRLGSAYIIIAASNLGWDDECRVGATRNCEVTGWALRTAGTEADPQEAKDALDLLGYIEFPAPEGAGGIADMQGELLEEAINQAKSFLDEFDERLRRANGVAVFAQIKWEECEERSCFPTSGVKLWTEKTKVVENIPPKPGSQHQLNQDAWREDHLSDADRLEDLMDWIEEKALEECP